MSIKVERKSKPAGNDSEVQFNNSGAFGADSNLNWDNTNKRLGIGGVPSTALDVAGTITGSALASEIGLQMQGDKSTNIPDIEIKDTAGNIRFGYSNTGGINTSFAGTNLLIKGGDAPSVVAQSNPQGLAVIYSTNTQTDIFGSRYTVTSGFNGGTMTGFSGEMVATGSLSKATGMFAQFISFNTVTITDVFLADVKTIIQNATVTNMTGYRSMDGLLLSGTITNFILFKGKSPSNFGATVTNMTGLDLDDVSLGSTNHAIRTRAGNIVFNENGDANTDLRVEGNTDQNLLFTDASTDRVGIGATPNSKLQVAGAISTPIATKTGAYTITETDSVILADATTAAFTITLPAAVAGRKYTIKKIDASANAVTVDGNASETIDGALTHNILLQYDTIQIVSDGTNWFIV